MTTKQIFRVVLAFPGDVQREMPWLLARVSIREAMMQVVMHSQHHRGQCASRLRVFGGTPPTLDFIVWLKDRPAAWS